MKRLLSLLVGVFFCTALAFAADQTWTGKISDSNCGESHKSAIEHSGKKLTDHDCAVACVKGGGTYVFVAKGKTYKIANQDFASLEEHAGHQVTLTGEMKDDAITVSKIEMGAKKKS